VIGISGRLSKKASIPAVAKKMDTINLARDKEFWAQGSIPGIERIRVELREIVKFLDVEQQPIYFTSFTDEFDGDVSEISLVYNVNNLDAYKRRVEQYLKENSTHITISKLRNNVPITKSELDELERMLFDQGTIGTKEDFINAYGEQPLGKFIRGIIGLDINAAKKAFAELLSLQSLNSQQIRFIDTIINFLTVKGTVDPAMLFESPFTDVSSDGISGLFDDELATKIISLLERVNENAVAA
jgi:type I restriction enzyme R subunit